jgi:hypothetical protein
MRPGQHLDRLGEPRVAGHPAVTVPIGAHQIGQHPRIPRSDLAREMGCRSRSRLAANGLTAITR